MSGDLRPRGEVEALTGADFSVLLLGDLLVIAALLACVVFGCVYAYLVAWENHKMGRYLIQAVAALILVLSLPTNYVVLRATYPLHGWWRAAAYLFLLYVAVRFTLVLLHLQRAGRTKTGDSRNERASDRDAAHTGGTS